MLRLSSTEACVAFEVLLDVEMLHISCILKVKALAFHSHLSIYYSFILAKKISLQPTRQALAVGMSVKMKKIKAVIEKICLTILPFLWYSSRSLICGQISIIRSGSCVHSAFSPWMWYGCHLTCELKVVKWFYVLIFL